MNFESEQEQNWIESYVNGNLDEGALADFEAHLTISAGARARLRRYLRLDAQMRAKASDVSPLIAAWKPKPIAVPLADKPATRWRSTWLPTALAASFVILATLLLWPHKEPSSSVSLIESAETTMRGYAVIRRMVQPEWANGETARRSGDLLTEGKVRLQSGLIQIDFFCGATVVVQGPVELDITSAWGATCVSGRLRAVVPPAARGFRILTAQGEVEDLGTEFALSVQQDTSQVNVLEGKVIVHPNQGAAREVRGGDVLKLSPDGLLATVADSAPTSAGLDEIRVDDAERERREFIQWEEHSRSLRQDPRLIAYYPMAADDWTDNVLHDRAPHADGGEPCDAILLGFASRLPGRFDAAKSALDVKRPDARARVHIPGEFSAFTFAAWVRIDSLSRLYNALFMGDNYNTGEPHWQIREDGKLMLSVMVDDTKEPMKPGDRGLHRLFYSPVFWQESMSGKWLHLASTYDPVRREAAHFLNGVELSREPIPERFHISTLRIGSAEIGSWGLPFKANDAQFAVRNLNGRMDELAIFNAALNAAEIKALHESGKKLNE